MIDISESPLPSLKVVPELNDYWLLEGSPLKLDCIYTRPKTVTPQTFDFYYNGVLVENGKNGFTVSCGLHIVLSTEGGGDVKFYN